MTTPPPLYPLVFHPRFKETIWGGRRLEALYHKQLPPGVSIGESWEISDRPGDESVIVNGAFSGRSLRWLMERHGAAVLGTAAPAAGGRFPLLCKLLDARDVLSLQVHPPPDVAPALGGEPKTELWYVADADPGAELYVGLRSGVSRESFEAAVRTGTVADSFHRVAVHSGDAMFLPSGRVHAIGAGLVIFEIQQSSDTTYRVFDWNRPGLDGRPRELHIDQSMASIAFDDFEPGLVRTTPVVNGAITTERLVDDALFGVALMRSQARATVPIAAHAVQIAAVVQQRLIVNGPDGGVELTAGQFCLIPACLTGVTLTFERGSSALLVEAR